MACTNNGDGSITKDYLINADGWTNGNAKGQVMFASTNPSDPALGLTFLKDANGVSTYGVGKMYDPSDDTTETIWYCQTCQDSLTPQMCINKWVNEYDLATVVANDANLDWSRC